MRDGVTLEQAAEFAAATDGCSFAQLRELYIMAGQLAFEDLREILFEDLRLAVRQFCSGSGGAGRFRSRSPLGFGSGGCVPVQVCSSADTGGA